MPLSFPYATPKDFKWLKTKEHHIDSLMLKRKIEAKEILLAQSEGKTIGWLRFGFFWDSIPFISMLFIEDEYRGKGAGKKLVYFWEKQMKKKKFKLAMTSSLSNEEAQHFYRKLGYTDAGSLTLPKEPLEIFFIKPL